MEPKLYPFPINELEERGYCVFPDELENDEYVFFHATALENLASIRKKGILPGIDLGGGLTTISYAPKSVIALTHWVTIRRSGQDGLILALKFETHNEIFVEGGTHYSRALKTQPVIVGVCEIPSTYEHR